MATGTNRRMHLPEDAWLEIFQYISIPDFLMCCFLWPLANIFFAQKAKHDAVVMVGSSKLQHLPRHPQSRELCAQLRQYVRVNIDSEEHAALVVWFIEHCVNAQGLALASDSSIGSQQKMWEYFDKSGALRRVTELHIVDKQDDMMPLHTGSWLLGKVLEQNKHLRVHLRTDDFLSLREQHAGPVREALVSLDATVLDEPPDELEQIVNNLNNPCFQSLSLRFMQLDVFLFAPYASSNDIGRRLTALSVPAALDPFEFVDISGFPELKTFTVKLYSKEDFRALPWLNNIFRGLRTSQCRLIIEAHPTHLHDVTALVSFYGKLEENHKRPDLVLHLDRAGLSTWWYRRLLKDIRASNFTIVDDWNFNNLYVEALGYARDLSMIVLVLVCISIMLWISWKGDLTSVVFLSILLSYFVDIDEFMRRTYNMSIHRVHKYDSQE